MGDVNIVDGEERVYVVDGGQPDGGYPGPGPWGPGHPGGPGGGVYVAEGGYGGVNVTDGYHPGGVAVADGGHMQPGFGGNLIIEGYPDYGGGVNVVDHGAPPAMARGGKVEGEEVEEEPEAEEEPEQ